MANDLYGETIFSPRWFMENMLYITDKRGRLIPFKLNYEQSVMLQHIEFCLDNDIPIRMIVLKARQIGSTTFFTGLGFWFAAMHKNMNYNIVAHRLDSAESIFTKCKVFYNNLIKEMRPETTSFSSETIVFDKKGGKGVGSKIKFATASDGVFRGLTIQYLHQSERAFYEGSFEAIDNSLNPTVADAPWTIIVKESTARGYNVFKDEWDQAVRGESGYKPFFFGWQDHKEYTVDKVPAGFILTDDEKRLKEKLNLTDNQIAWRRRKIETDYKGNAEVFTQEYPSTPEEAFVAGGFSAFKRETILAGYENSKPPKMEIELQSVPVHEKLLVWEEPIVEKKKVYAQKAEWNFDKQEYEYVDTDLLLEENSFMRPYTVGVDTSGFGADKNQVVVVDNISKKSVARFGIKNLSEELLAKVVVEIARMYNNALVAPEVNYSHEIVNFILKEGYKNIYVTENINRQDNKIAGIEYGWKTTVTTKPQIVSYLRGLLNNDPSLIQDREFWYEAEYYIVEDPIKRIVNAASGHFDDIVMAEAIAQYVSNSMQAKQSLTVVREQKEIPPQFKHFFKNAGYKDNKLRKGVYNNNA